MPARMFYDDDADLSLIQNRTVAVLEVVNLFRAKVVDVGTESVTIEATGTADKLAALLKVLEPYGVREMVQSGMVAVGRGPRSITGTALRSLDRSA